MINDSPEKLSGKIALITGGSRGIGKAIACAYACEGARVFICGRDDADVKRAVKEIRDRGGGSEGACGDIGKPEDVRCIVRAALARFGTIDVLVNNASMLGPRVTVAEYPAAAWEEVVRVNLTGVFLVTQEVLKVMIPRGRGSILNVSSGVGRTGKARWGAYAAAKFGVEGFTQVLADELKGTGIRVNSINPGPTRTSMRAAAYPDEDPLTLKTPDQITERFIYLASDESCGVTGQSLDAQG